MTKNINKTTASEELLNRLLALPTDLEAIEKLLKERNYSSDDVSRAGYDFAEYCWDEVLDYADAHEDEFTSMFPKLIPDLCSTQMARIFELLLKYGLDPNTVCDGDTLMGCVCEVYNEYVAADTLELLLSNGGDPFMMTNGTTLFSEVDGYVIFDAIELERRSLYDSYVHCWFVMLGHSDNLLNGKEIVTVMPSHLGFEGVNRFEISDLRNHRNFTFGITDTPCRGDSWSLHIFNKRTCWEVARL